MDKLEDCGFEEFERISDTNDTNVRMKRTDNSKYHLHIKKEWLYVYVGFRLVWSWGIMTILKSLPTNFVHMVFGKYSPNSHFFLSKALPILYGSKFLIISSSTGLLLFIAIQCIGALYFAFLGIYERSPWISCPNQTVTLNNFRIRCYELEEYLHFVKDVPKNNIISITSGDWFIYKTEDNEEKFILPQFLFLGTRLRHFYENRLAVGFHLLVLAGVVILTKDAIYKKPIWKFIKYTHFGQIVMFSAIWLHMIYLQIHNEIPDYTSTTKKSNNFREDVQNFVIINTDIWILSETLTCPPVLHFLTARSNNRIFPNSASAVLAMMNSIYLFSVNRLTFNINAYLLSILSIDIKNSKYNKFSELITYGLYFNTFYFGEIFHLIYIIFSSITLIIALVVALHILVETMISEWKWMNVWALLLIWSVGYAFVDIFYGNLIQEVVFTSISFHIYAIIMEMMALIVLYPYRRFIDDVLFQFGYPTTIFQNVTYALGLLSTVVFLLLGMHAVIHYENASESMVYPILIRNRFLYMVIIMILGAIYESSKMIFFQWKSWQQLFVPYPEWGPSDYQLRTQRKHFIGSEYIESQAPRELSRTMIRRRNHEVYSLDIVYMDAPDTTSISYAQEKKDK